jgi:hypothetical protein
MPFFKEEDIAFDPVFVGLFGTIGIVLEAKSVADLIEYFFALWLGSDFLHVDLKEEKGI